MTFKTMNTIFLLVLYCFFLQVPFSRALCAEAEFPCANRTDVCVPQDKQCDGINDCGNNADELNCARIEGLTSDFDKKKLILPAGNSTQPPSLENLKLEECELEQFPSSCFCYMTTLSCQDQSMDSVPQGISENLTRLNLLGNNITKLDDGALRNYTKLIYLNLQSNNLREISSDAFVGLQNLGSLYLNNNFLEDIEAKTFKHLDNVHWLFLENNTLTSIDEHDFYGLKALYWLTLSKNNLTDLKKTVALRDTPSLAWLDLEWNDFQYLHPDNFTGIHEVNMSLNHLGLSHCNIEEIHHDTFTGFITLASLALQENRIRHFPADLFKKLVDIQTLNISFNPVTVLPPDVFNGLHSLQTLYLNGIKIKNINKGMFQNVSSLEHVEFYKYSYCQYVPHVRACLPRTDGISSFENLLRNIVLRVFVWTVALLTSIGNIGVFISRVLMKSECKHHSLAVINLCGADFIMSIYLFNIAIHDSMFRENYNKYSFEWMESWSCQISGFLAMVSGEVSVLILTFISVERCVTIAYPYRSYKCGKRELAAILSCIWLAGITIGMIPLLIPSSFGNFYGSNGVCFPLHIHDPTQKGWEYSAFVFLAINASAFSVIFISYIGMFTSIQRTRKCTAHINRKGDMNYAKRFLCIVMTDLLCWLPIAIIKIMALGNIVVSETLYGWLIVFVLPINSALNPILYTMSTTSFSQWFNKQFSRGKTKAITSRGYLSYNHWRNSRKGGRTSSFTETTDFIMASVSRRSCPDIKIDAPMPVLHPIFENHMSDTRSESLS